MSDELQNFIPEDLTKKYNLLLLFQFEHFLLIVASTMLNVESNFSLPTLIFLSLLYSSLIWIILLFEATSRINLRYPWLVLWKKSGRRELWLL
jgi:hypothetical protein